MTVAIRRARLGRDELNPYIAITDTSMNLILVMVFLVAALTSVGRVSWDDVRYKDGQKVFAAAVERRIPAPQRPSINSVKNDPPGTQRWVFLNSSLFKPGSDTLALGGATTLDQFADALRANLNTWRRIRIEGHTMPTLYSDVDHWEDATTRAAVVARYLVARGRIPPYFIATAGRGGQDPLPGIPLSSPAHARIEIVLEYGKLSAQGK